MPDDGDEREPESHEHEREPETNGGRDAWESQSRETLTVSLETLQRTNQALELQARRMDDLAKLHESHMRQWEESLAETRDLMKAAREAQASADQARSELVSVTAALVKVATVQQQMLQALSEESQS